MEEPSDTRAYLRSAPPSPSGSALRWLRPRRLEWLALALFFGGMQLRRRAVEIGVKFGDASAEGVRRAMQWAEASQQAGSACLLIAGGLMLYVLFTRRSKGGGLLATSVVLWVAVSFVALLVIVAAMAGAPIAR